jgi:hypothetical protein
MPARYVSVRAFYPQWLVTGGGPAAAMRAACSAGREQLAGTAGAVLEVDADGAGVQHRPYRPGHVGRGPRP